MMKTGATCIINIQVEPGESGLGRECLLFCTFLDDISSKFSL